MSRPQHELDVENLLAQQDYNRDQSAYDFGDVMPRVEVPPPMDRQMIDPVSATDLLWGWGGNMATSAREYAAERETMGHPQRPMPAAGVRGFPAWRGASGAGVVTKTTRAEIAAKNTADRLQMESLAKLKADELAAKLAAEEEARLAEIAEKEAELAKEREVPVADWLKEDEEVAVVEEEVEKEWTGGTNYPIQVDPEGQSLLPICLMFPGQGAQFVGMVKKLIDLPIVQHMAVEAEKILGYDVADICMNGPEAKIEETRFCQPCLLFAGLAAMVKLYKERPQAVLRASGVCGFSVGEYVGLCVAGVLTFEDAFRIVKVRAEAMHEAAMGTGGQMLSVIGFPAKKLHMCVQECCVQTNEVCAVSIFMFPDAYVCGGSPKAIDMLNSFCKKKGASRCTILPTAGAFHTPMMLPAADSLSKVLDEVLPRMKPPNCNVWMTVNPGSPTRPGTDPVELLPLMKSHLINTVHWQPTMEAIVADGTQEFYEVGPGKQLKTMLRRIKEDAAKTCKCIDV